MPHVGKKQDYTQLQTMGFSEKQISVMSLNRLVSILGISRKRAGRLQHYILGKFKMFGPTNVVQKSHKYRIYQEPDREPIDFLAASMFFGAPSFIAKEPK